MKEYRTIPSTTTVFVVSSLWWGAIAVISAVGGQAVLAAACAAVAIFFLWGVFKFAGSTYETELRDSVRQLPTERSAPADRAA